MPCTVQHCTLYSTVLYCSKLSRRLVALTIPNIIELHSSKSLQSLIRLHFRVTDKEFPKHDDITSSKGPVHTSTSSALYPPSCPPLGVEDPSHAEVDGGEDSLSCTLLGGVGRQLHGEEARVAHLQNRRELDKHEHLTSNCRVYNTKPGKGMKKCSRVVECVLLRSCVLHTIQHFPLTKHNLVCQYTSFKCYIGGRVTGRLSSLVFRRSSFMFTLQKAFGGRRDRPQANRTNPL